MKIELGEHEVTLKYKPFKVICNDVYINQIVLSFNEYVFNPLTYSVEHMSVKDGELQAYLLINHMISSGYNIRILKHDTQLHSHDKRVY